ncbi:C2H2-type zinc finger protein [Candidatus Nitrosotalea okcheonensis]|uniref:C2H2-type zinc finger protein n=1 Tax=Candidatus Nitrosotalea okcheonensis TaxID=1903276 RepID=UPI0013000138|nr:C2H2-type zinc finger protein [Candidatus Nitrosotalea okcheonensis]
MNIFKKFKCDLCGTKFRQQEYLMLHQQLHHCDKHYDCKECNKFFSSMEEMRTHMQRAHSYNGTRDV